MLHEPPGTSRLFRPLRQGGEEAVRFRESVLTDVDVQWVQARMRQRVLRWFARFYDLTDPLLLDRPAQ